MNDQTKVATRVNGIDLAAVGAIAEAVEADAKNAEARFAVTTRWTGGCRTETRSRLFTLGGNPLAREHVIAADEPFEMLGSDSAPNPQELLLAALNACVTVGIVLGAAAQGIELRALEVDCEGELDLRGFLDAESGIAPGVDSLAISVKVDTDAPDEALDAIVDHVRKVSPNFFHLTTAIPVSTRWSR